MKSANRHRRRAIAAAFLALLSGGVAAWLLVLAVTKARMPYNDQGRYFDGMVVHHAGAEYVYGGLALLFGVFAVLFGVWATRIVRRARADSRRIDTTVT